MELHGFEEYMLMSSSDLKSINVKVKKKKKSSLPFHIFGRNREGTVLVGFGAAADGQ